MIRSLRRLTLILILGLLSLSILASSHTVYANHRPGNIPTLAHNPATIIDPTKIANTNFQTNVTITNAVDVFNWQITISYNATVLQLLGMNVANTYFDQCIDGTTGLLKIGTAANPCNPNSPQFDTLVYFTLASNTPGQSTFAYTMLNQASPSPSPIPLTCSSMPPITSLTCPTAAVKLGWKVLKTGAFSSIHLLLDTEDPVAGTLVADSTISRELYNTQDGFFSNIAMVPPVAQFTATPASPNSYPNATIGTSVSFDGTASTGAANYKWSFGDGTPPVSGATTSTTSHAYNPTVPTPTVTVATNTSTPLKFKPVGLNITASDPGGFIAATYVDWGDGTKLVLPPQLSYPNSAPPLVSLAHSYPTIGTFHVNVTATNAVAVRSVLVVNGTTPGTWNSASKMIILSPGKSASQFRTITVINAPPIVSISADKTTAFKGDTITLTITSSDPDGVVTATRVNWGDGTVHSLTGAATSDTHSYSNKGTYTANVTVTDNDGATASATTLLTIQDKAPVAGFSSTPASPTTADTITFTDSSTDPDGTVTTWSWSFGDGTTSTVQNPTHQYSAAGTYTVKLNVTDNDGSTNAVTKTITVVAPPSPPSQAPFLGGPVVWAGIAIAAVAALLLFWQLVLKKRRTAPASSAAPTRKP